MGSGITPSLHHTSVSLKLHHLRAEDTKTKLNAAVTIRLLQEKVTHEQVILKPYNTSLGELEPLHTEKARALHNATGCGSCMIMKHRNRLPDTEVLPALAALIPLKQDFEKNEPDYNMTSHPEST